MFTRGSMVALRVVARAPVSTLLKRGPWFCASFAVVLVICARFAVAAEPDSLRQRFESEAPAAWQRWERQLASIDVRYHVFREQFIRSEYPRVREDKTVEYFATGDKRRLHLFMTLDDATKVEEVVVSRGDEYTFRAERRDSDAMTISDLIHGPAADEPSTSMLWLHAPYSIEYVRLTRWMSNPRFAIKSFTAEDRPDGRRFARLAFEYQHAGDRTARFQSGHVDLSPDDDWLVQQYRVKTPEGAYRAQSIEYGPRRGPSQPIAKIKKDYIAMDGQTLGGTDVMTFERWEERRHPDDFFSFAAVGLPEIGPPQRQSRWFVLILMGTLLLLLGLVMYFRLRKREGA